MVSDVCSVRRDIAPVPSDPLLNVAEVADYLNVPVSRVYDKWQAWGLPAFKVGTSLRFRRSEVEAWLETNRA